MIRIVKVLDTEVVELFQSGDIKDKSIAEKLVLVNDLSEYNRNVVTILLDSMIEKDRVEKLQQVKMKSRLAELDKIRRK